MGESNVFLIAFACALVVLLASWAIPPAFRKLRRRVRRLLRYRASPVARYEDFHRLLQTNSSQAARGRRYRPVRTRRRVRRVR
jgi:hypothetical protein